MPMQWVPPELFLKHKGVEVFHAYKDGQADIVLSYHYSASENEEPSSEFDVRDLPGYDPKEEEKFVVAERGIRKYHKRIIRRAIENGVPPFPKANGGAS